MNKSVKLLAVCLLLLPLLLIGSPVYAEDIQAKKLDSRAKILAEYLAGFNSPLQYHAQDFIDAAENFGLDWRLLPAIAGVESTFGKQIPGGFNAWGWGVYGNQAIYFKSWKEGIFTIAKGLRENYLDKGLKDPYTINRAYAASPFWGGRVSFFMQELEKFAAGEKSANKTASEAAEVKSSSLVKTQTAASSGQLALK